MILANKKANENFDCRYLMRFQKSVQIKSQYYYPDYPDMVGINEFCKMVGFSKRKGYQVLNNYGIEYFHIKDSYWKIPKVDIYIFKTLIYGEK